MRPEDDKAAVTTPVSVALDIRHNKVLLLRGSGESVRIGPGGYQRLV